MWGGGACAPSFPQQKTVTLYIFIIKGQTEKKPIKKPLECTPFFFFLSIR